MSETVVVSSGSLTVDISPPSVQSVAGSTDSGSPTSISRDGQLTIVQVEATTDHTYVQLPGDAEVGDVVEVWITSPSTHYSGSPGVVTVYPPASQYFVWSRNGGNTSAPGPSTFRKLGSDAWSSTN